MSAQKSLVSQLLSEQNIIADPGKARPEAIRPANHVADVAVCRISRENPRETMRIVGVDGRDEGEVATSSPQRTRTAPGA